MLALITKGMIALKFITINRYVLPYNVKIKNLNNIDLQIKNRTNITVNIKGVN